MDDLISRTAACECIGKMIHEYREKGEDDLADGMILARRYVIKCLPTVDAIPVEWLRNEADRQKDMGEWADADVIYWLIQTWQKKQEAKT